MQALTHVEVYASVAIQSWKRRVMWTISCKVFCWSRIAYCRRDMSVYIPADMRECAAGMSG